MQAQQFLPQPLPWLRTMVGARSERTSRLQKRRSTMARAADMPHLQGWREKEYANRIMPDANRLRSFARVGALIAFCGGASRSCLPKRSEVRSSTAGKRTHNLFEFSRNPERGFCALIDAGSFAGCLDMALALQGRTASMPSLQVPLALASEAARATRGGRGSGGFSGSGVPREPVLGSGVPRDRVAPEVSGRRKVQSD